MPDKENVAGAIGGLQADVKNLTLMMGEMKQFLITNARSNTDVKISLAIIEGKQDDMKKYQERCDNERKALDERLDSHESRIKEGEGFQSRLMRNSVWLIVVCNALIGYTVEWFRK